MVTNEELITEYEKLPYDNCIRNTQTSFMYNIKTGLLIHPSNEGDYDYYVIPGSWYPVWDNGEYICHVQDSEKYKIGEY